MKGDDLGNAPLTSYKPNVVTNSHGSGGVFINSEQMRHLFNDQRQNVSTSYEDRANEEVISNFKLDNLTISYNKYGNDSGGYDHTYTYINGNDAWENDKSGISYISANFSRDVTKYSGLTNQEINAVTPYLFTVLNNSTPQKDLKHGGQFFTDKTNPPPYHWFDQLKSTSSFWYT